VAVSTAATPNRSGAGAVGGAVDVARARFPTPLLFDIFESDGRFVGRVRVPASLHAAAIHLVHGDYAWFVVRDAYDEPVVERFHILW
jgi:hypothetical protein